MTMDAGCTWDGELTAADVTCTWTVDGSMWAKSARGLAQTSTLRKEEFGDFVTGGGQEPYEFAALTIVEPTATGTSAPTGTETGSPESTGMAAAGAYPTGVLGLVGGAVAVLGAAVAL